MIVAPVILARRPGLETLLALHGHFSRFTTPAMIPTLGLGLWLALQGGWFRAGCLHAKLVLVLALAALHGLLSGRKRRLATQPDSLVPRWIGGIGWAVVACVLAIAVLAVVKRGS